MKITLDSNLQDVRAVMLGVADQIPYATMLALNKTALQAKSEIQTEMPKAFDRPTAWVINSIRVKFATKTEQSAWIGFKDKDSADYRGEQTWRSMIEPNVNTGNRHFKAMEARLMAIGLIPSGYNAVPGGAATLDANGNMSRGQISQLLNVLGTYTEAGYNKANSKTITRLAKGSVKKNVFGFVYWVNKVGGGTQNHLQPGVYQRVSTPFGSSLKPILIFVKRANYKQKLDFFGIVQKVVDRDQIANFSEAFQHAVATAKP